MTGDGSPEQFMLDISAFISKVGQRADVVTKKVIIDMGTRLVQLSPVGDPELWARNAVTMMNREAYQLFKEGQGKRRVTRRTLAKKFPTSSAKGYVGGRFRANWQYGVDAPPEAELFEPDAGPYPSAGAVVAALASSIGGTTAGGASTGLAGHLHYLVNNLPYAQRLEEGWSSQAPSGMVAITVVEFQGYVDKAAQSLPP